MSDPESPLDRATQDQRGACGRSDGERPLTDCEADAHVTELCGSVQLDTVTRIGIRERAAGSPLVLRELTRYALECGDSLGRHDPLSPHCNPLPARIVDIFRGRLAGLTPRQLAGLGVLGRVRKLPADLGRTLFSTDELESLVAAGFVVRHPPGSDISADQVSAECAYLLAEPALIAEAEKSLAAAVLSRAGQGRPISDSEAVVIDGCWSAGSTLDAEASRHGVDVVSAVLVGAARYFTDGGYSGAALAAAQRAYEFQASIAAAIEYSRALIATRHFERALSVLAAAPPHIVSVTEAIQLVRWWTILAGRQPVSRNEFLELADGAAGWGWSSDELDGEIELARLTNLYRSLERSTAAQFAESIAQTERFGPLVRARAATIGALLRSVLGESAAARRHFDAAAALLEEQAASQESVPDPNDEFGAYFFSYGLTGRLLSGVTVEESQAELDRQVGQRIRNREYLALGHLSAAAGEVARYRGDSTLAALEFHAALRRYAQLDPRGMGAFVKTRLALTLGDGGHIEDAIEFLRQAEVEANDFGTNEWAVALIRYTRAILSATSAPQQDVPGANPAGGATLFEAVLLYRRFTEGADAVELVAPLEAAAATLRSSLVHAAALHLRSFVDKNARGLDRAAAAFAGIESFGYAQLAAEDAAQLHTASGDRAAAKLSQLRARDYAILAGEPSPGVGLGELTYTSLLSEREREVVFCAVDGLSNRRIAATLSMSLRSVESYLRQAREKLGSRSRDELTALLRNERERERES